MFCVNMAPCNCALNSKIALINKSKWRVFLGSKRHYHKRNIAIKTGCNAKKNINLMPLYFPPSLNLYFLPQIYWQIIAMRASKRSDAQPPQIVLPTGISLGTQEAKRVRKGAHLHD